jgi:hypothetical protein
MLRHSWTKSLVILLNNRPASGEKRTASPFKNIFFQFFVFAFRS